MKLITLDIETVLDQAAADRCLYRSDDDFAPWPLHSLACISMLIVERVDWNRLAFSIQTLSRRDMSEHAMLDELEQNLTEANQVLTYNGLGFDVPVLLARAALAGIAVPTIAQLQARSRPGFHLDLLRVVTGNGAAPSVKLQHLCAALGVPVKLEAGGPGVAERAEQGDYERIGLYCQYDVVSTWLAAQQWDGAQIPGHGRERWDALAAWIAEDQPRLAHLLPYCAIPPVAPTGGLLSSDSSPIFEGEAHQYGIHWHDVPAGIRLNVVIAEAREQSGLLIADCGEARQAKPRTFSSWTVRLPRPAVHSLPRRPGHRAL